jgi:hypothetical protein
MTERPFGVDIYDDGSGNKVEAIKWTGENPYAVRAFTGEFVRPNSGARHMVFTTQDRPEGELFDIHGKFWSPLEFGLWIIKIPSGYFYSQSDEVFQRYYKKVEEMNEEETILEKAKHDAEAVKERYPEGLPFSSPDEADADQYLNRAKRLVVIDRQSHGDITVTSKDVYVTWFSKTLQNWKAVLSTNRPDGRYYELTHNGDKEETYFDSYIKVENNVYDLNDVATSKHSIPVAPPYDR